MKIGIVSANYPPETVVGGRMICDLAEGLVQRGHEVVVITPFPSRPLGTSYPGYEKRQVPLITKNGGLTVLRLPSHTQPQYSLLGRAWEGWSFGRSVARWLRKEGRDFDVLHEDSWPLFTQHWVGKTADQLGIPLITTIMDVYPESLLEKIPKWAGLIVESPIRAWDKAIVNRAVKVVVLSQSMKELYVRTRGVPPHRLEVVYTWQDERLFLEPQERAQCAVKYQVPPGAFSFMYMGNIGPVAGVEHLIHSFHQAQIPGTQLIIAGSGSQKAACVELVQQLQAANVRFVSDPDIANVPKMQSLADVFLLPLKKGTAGSSIPSKLAAYMFSGKPILATVDRDSATAQAVIDAQGGWVGPAEDQAWLAGMMRQVAQMKAGELAEMGRKAHTYGLSCFSKKEGVNRLAEIVLGVGRGRDSRR